MSHKKWDGIKKGLIVSLIGAVVLMGDKDKEKADNHRKISEGIAYMQMEKSMDLEGWTEAEKKEMRMLCEKTE